MSERAPFGDVVVAVEVEKIDEGLARDLGRELWDDAGANERVAVRGHVDLVSCLYIGQTPPAEVEVERTTITAGRVPVRVLPGIAGCAPGVPCGRGFTAGVHVFGIDLAVLPEVLDVARDLAGRQGHGPEQERRERASPGVRARGHVDGAAAVTRAEGAGADAQVAADADQRCGHTEDTGREGVNRLHSSSMSSTMSALDADAHEGSRGSSPNHLIAS